MNHQKIIEISKALKPADFDARCWHTTFAFRKGKLLAIGVNKPRHTHPKNLEFDYRSMREVPSKKTASVIGTHSEMICLLRLGFEDVSRITFFNVRIDRNGEANLARPCSGCLHALQSLNFRKLYFTNSKGEFEKL